MKSPDEIKKGLEYCGNEPYCDGDCEYYESADSCGCKLSNDALAYIQQLEETISSLGHLNVTMYNEAKKGIQELESRLAQVERERDAAFADMYKCCANCKHFDEIGEEEDCSAEECTSLNGGDPSGWEWRGVCEENAKEE